MPRWSVFASWFLTITAKKYEKCCSKHNWILKKVTIPAGFAEFCQFKKKNAQYCSQNIIKYNKYYAKHLRSRSFATAFCDSPLTALFLTVATRTCMLYERSTNNGGSVVFGRSEIQLCRHPRVAVAVSVGYSRIFTLWVKQKCAMYTLFSNRIASSAHAWIIFGTRLVRSASGKPIHNQYLRVRSASAIINSAAHDLKIRTPYAAVDCVDSYRLGGSVDIFAQCASGVLRSQLWLRCTHTKHARCLETRLPECRLERAQTSAQPNTSPPTTNQQRSSNWLHLNRHDRGRWHRQCEIVGLAPAQPLIPPKPGRGKAENRYCNPFGTRSISDVYITWCVCMCRSSNSSNRTECDICGVDMFRSVGSEAGNYMRYVDNGITSDDIVSQSVYMRVAHDTAINNESIGVSHSAATRWGTWYDRKIRCNLLTWNTLP